MQSMPSVYEYKDYRLFLKAHYQAKKRLDLSFTYRRFSLAAGLKSPNMLKLVIDAKKNLTNASTVAFAHALELSADEREFFFNLVQYNQSENARESKFFQAKLQLLKPARESRNSRAGVRSGLYENIFTTIAACLLQGKSVGEEFSVLKTCLGLTGSAARTAVESLTNTGLLQQELGHWKIEPNHVVFQERVPSEVMRSFLRNQLLLSISALDSGRSAEVKNISHCMTVDPHGIPDLQDQIDSFFSKLNRLFERQNGTVMQINCQSFEVKPSIVADFLRKTKQR